MLLRFFWKKVHAVFGALQKTVDIFSVRPNHQYTQDHRENNHDAGIIVYKEIGYNWEAQRRNDCTEWNIACRNKYD